MKLPCKYGPYLLLERVSVGGMAEVYKAKEYGVDGFERTVAVKRILPHVAEDDEFIAMFKDEAKIAVQLAHGNIAQIYNLGNENESFYIALEYIAGRDLRAIFQKGQQAGKPMPVPQVCYVIMKICEGLDYAHNKKDKYQRPLSIIHRDVSPPNILVSYEGEVKLIDFGVAKAAGRASRTQAGILKGKFGYMSPEQVRGMPLDRRSDVFSVGVVLFETLTGTRLFQAETDFATLEKVRAVEVPRPTSLNPEIPKPLENIMYKALAREPETRYQSSIELHDELQAFMFAQGMFYSRKDLAGWMRVQYAREIELEKEKDKAQASLRPEMFEVPTGEQAESGTPGPRRQRKTMMMPGGSKPPPPPPSGGRKPPPPPPHGARPRTGGAAAAKPPRAPSPPTAAHQSVPIGPPLPNKKVKRKTMAQAANRASLPPPPGARRKDEALTIPVDGGMQRPSAAPLSRPRPKPSATSSYAAVETSDVDFDWDDDELETRLFEDEAELPGGLSGGAAASTGGANRVSTPGENRDEPVVGGAIAATPSASDEAPAQPQASVTVIPPSAAAASAPAMTMPAPMQAPAQAPVPAPQAPGPMAMPQAPQAAASMPAAPAMHPGMAPRPEIVPATVDYDERPANKGNTGAIIGILVAVIVLLIAGFGAYLVLNRDDVTEVAASSASGGVQTPGKAADTAPPAADGGAVTLAVIPPDAKVFVDNKPQEGESPFIVQSIGVGKHKLLVKKDGYMPLEKEFVLSQSSLLMQFELQHRDVTLLLETDPKGAAVNLLTDGKATAMGAGGTEYKLTRVPGAKYEVEAVLAGFKSRRQDLSFGGSDTEKVSITLSRDASIADAGRPAAPAPTPATAPAPAPAATKPKPPRKTKPRPSRPASKPAPKKSQAKTSLLRIGTLAGVAPAKVFVDGSPKGSTPLGKVMVTPGRHKVVFQWPNGKRVTKFVEVADGRSAIVRGG